MSAQFRGVDLKAAVRDLHFCLKGEFQKQPTQRIFICVLSFYGFIIAKVLQLQMENNYFLPAQLCDRIFAHEFEMDTGNISEDLLTNTVQLYVEAISYYSSLIAQLSVQPDFDPSALAKRTKFYQEKIKRLLVRTDVQQCLVGKKRNPKGLDLQKELAKVSLHAPEQARALLNHYTSHLKQQQNLIESSLARQRNDLAERIERRSKSKRKSVKNVDQMEILLPKLKVSPLLLNF